MDFAWPLPSVYVDIMIIIGEKLFYTKLFHAISINSQPAQVEPPVPVCGTSSCKTRLIS